MEHKFSLFFFAISLSTCVFSRELAPGTDFGTFDLLDVSGAIQRTFDAVYHASRPFEWGDDKTASASSHSSLSLELRPVHGGAHKDYRALMLARLAHDSARAEAIYTKLQRAVSGTGKSDLKPMDPKMFQPEDFSTPVTSGLSQGCDQYFLRIGIGRPPKPFYMVIDTGSDVNWLQCQPCDNCYQQVDPIFDPDTSSSFSPLGCESPQCHNLEQSTCDVERMCIYLVSDRSYTIGDYATETVSFGTSVSLDKVAIGCGHQNK